MRFAWVRIIARGGFRRGSSRQNSRSAALNKICAPFTRSQRKGEQRENPMKKLALAIAAVGISMMGVGSRSANATDFLYIGDANDNTVKRFDARTGNYLGVFVTNIGCTTASPPTRCLFGPTGLIFDRHGDFDGRGHLLVANQNVNL